jgi:hypothetical protein
MSKRFDFYQVFVPLTIWEQKRLLKNYFLVKIIVEP